MSDYLVLFGCEICLEFVWWDYLNVTDLILWFASGIEAEGFVLLYFWLELILIVSFLHNPKIILNYLF